MMIRSRHPNKEIEEAVRYAERKNWRVILSSGHAWAKMYCPGAERGACVHCVYSTPKNPQNHAKQIVKFVDACRHPNSLKESKPVEAEPVVRSRKNRKEK